MLIAVQELDGKLLAEQAAVYANASIIVQAHGAALGKRANHSTKIYYKRTKGIRRS